MLDKGDLEVERWVLRLAPQIGLELHYFRRKQPFGDKPKLTTEEN